MSQIGLQWGTWRGYPGPRRGIVINSYVANSPNRTFPNVEDGSLMVYVDVLLIAPQIPLKRVPVMQRVGEVNAEPWIPKPTTRDILKNTPIAMLGPITRLGTPNPQGTQMPSFEHLDGDHVIVDFIGANPSSPIVVGMETHPATKRKVLEGAGFTVGASAATRGTAFRDERFMRFAGTEMRINGHGDVLLDTTGADPSDPIAETPIAGPGGGGSVQLALKAEKELIITDDAGVVILRARKVGGQMRVSLEGGLLRSMVLGEPLRDWLLALKVPTGVGLSGVPLNPSTGAPPVDLTIDVLSTRHQVA
jgi:hypothetical protein